MDHLATQIFGILNVNIGVSALQITQIIHDQGLVQFSKQDIQRALYAMEKLGLAKIQYNTPRPYWIKLVGKSDNLIKSNESKESKESKNQSDEPRQTTSELSPLPTYIPFQSRSHITDSSSPLVSHSLSLSESCLKSRDKNIETKIKEIQETKETTYCDVCHIGTTSVENFNDHLHGKAHMKRVKMMQSLEMIGFETEALSRGRMGMGMGMGIEMAMEKRPVSELQEVSVKYGLGVPIYKILVSDTSIPHRPTFVIEVNVSDMKAQSGRMNNKSDAKHDAAAQLLKLVKTTLSRG